MAPPDNRRIRTAALCGGYFLVLLDVTVVNVTLPSIGSALHMGGAGLAWVVDAYTVPLAALLLVAGALGDRLGHRPIVLAGFAGFGAASVLCALAPSAEVLVAGRAAQGASAALLLPGTLALLTGSAADDRERTRAVGLWAAVGGAALPAGPLAGGLLVGVAGWRSVFWLNVPVIAAALPALARTTTAARPRRSPGRTDWPGAFVLVVVLGGTVTAVIEAPHDRGAALLAAGVAATGAAGFRDVERRAEPPLLSVPCPARRPLRAACGVAGLMNLCVLGSLFLLTQLLQDVHHATPPVAGLLLLPGMLPLPLLGGPAGRLTHRIGAWRTAALGLAAAAAGFAGLATAVGGLRGPADTVLLLAALLVWGAGLGLLTPAIVAAALQSLPGGQGTASGGSNTARQTGGALGVAAFAALAGDARAPAFAGHAAALLAASAAAFAAATAYCLRRAPGSGRLGGGGAVGRGGRIGRGRGAG